MADLLIVDDEPQVRQLLKVYLKKSGYGCRMADSVSTAKEILACHPVDLILSDIDMPGESGFELIRYVKKNNADIPLIVVSVIDKPEEAQKALELGVYGYIVKPFTRNIVLINVENGLRRKQLEVEKSIYLNKLKTQVHQRTETLNNQVIFQQGLIDAIPSPVFYKNNSGRFQGCNTAFEVLVDKNREQIVGGSAFDFMPRSLAEISEKTDRQLMDAPGKISYEYDMAYPDQTVHNFLINKATFHDANGNVNGLAGVMVDLTDHRAAEEALRASEEKFRQIVENIGIGVSMIGKNMEILWMNRQMQNWFPEINVSDRPLCHRSFNMPPRKTICDNCPTVKALREGKHSETTAAIPLALGNFLFRVIATPIHDKNGKVIAAIELVEDITQKNALERELRQAQKLEAIGQLAAGIAHEINTPIQYVGDNTRFLEDAFEDIQPVMKAYHRLLAAIKTNSVTADMIENVERILAEADLPYLSEEVPGAIEQSLEGIQQVSKIIRAMRRFSHPGSDRKVEVDINQALESTVTVARNEWKYVAEIETDFADDLPAVHCFPAEMNQVFLNLIINASHAIGEASDDGRKGKGRITVTTRSDRTSVFITIGDTGGGIPEKIRNRIFDPFFTTKAVGKGTGQGLAIARSVIVEKHGGMLRFETKKEHGTTFIIELPLNDTEEGSPEDET
jgi:PAS domain S-box-containing protein